MTKNKFVFLLPPLRKKADTFFPLGILILAKLLRDIKWDVEIINIDQARYSQKEVLAMLRELQPNVIGWSAVTATAYSYIKEMTLLIKKEQPNALMFLGGNLCSVSDLLLNIGVDVVFVGEAEVSLPKVLKCIFDHDGIMSDIPGIIYRDESKGIICTGASERLPLKDRFSLLPREFDGIDLDWYIPPIEIPDHYGIQLSDYDAHTYAGERMITIQIQRGCQAQCTFCHRNSKYSPFSVDDVVDYMMHLRDYYNVYYFRLASESFIGKRDWILDFAEKVKLLNIVFDIGGARVDMVDYEILHSLKGAGCIAVVFGYESGDQVVLDEMNKGITVQENLNAALWTKELGLGSPPQLIIGYPGESISSLLQNLKFVRVCRRKSISCNMLQVLPGTPIYHYAIAMGYIYNEDDYMMAVSDKDASDLSSFVNMTKLNLYYLQAMRFLIGKSAYYSNRAALWYNVFIFLWGVVLAIYLLLKIPISQHLIIYIVSIIFRIDIDVKNQSIGNIGNYMKNKYSTLKCFELLKYGCVAEFNRYRGNRNDG